MNSRRGPGGVHLQSEMSVQNNVMSVSVPTSEIASEEIEDDMSSLNSSQKNLKFYFTNNTSRRTVEDVQSVTSEYINSKGRTLQRYEDINISLLSSQLISLSDKKTKFFL